MLTYENLENEYSYEINELEKVLLHASTKIEMSHLFYNYFNKLESDSKWLRTFFFNTAILSKYNFELQGKKILDIGCGFGLRLICSSLLGSSYSLGIDISKEMILEFKKLIRLFPRFKIKSLEGDFLNTNFNANSFDIIILEEAISHIRDTNLLLRKIKEILRPNGILYIQDCNNDLFIPRRIKIRKIWTKSEYGPIDTNMKLYGREVDKLSFFDARKKIIREKLSKCNEKTINYLARQTQGLYGDEITESIRQYLNNKAIFKKRIFPYRNPYTGEYPELGFNPFSLVKKLVLLGFKCNLVKPPWAYLDSRNITNNKSSERARFKYYAKKMFIKCPLTILPFINPCYHIVAKA